MTINSHSLSQQATGLRYLSGWMTYMAQSGHVGMPFGMADVCTVLWSEFINWSPQNPQCKNRDRFILSCGHGSALLYAILYSMGVLTLEDLANFRQLDSKTPGHPEISSIVEMTTGPLGQGLAWGIGMVKASMDLDKNHYTYIVCSDGDLMEGIAHESLALASLWKLKRCIVLWDDNKMTIDGDIQLSCVNDLGKLFLAHGWSLLECNGHDYESIYTSIVEARKADRPVCIRCKTVIGYPLPIAGLKEAHGGHIRNLQELKHSLGIDYDTVPQSVLNLWQSAIDRGNSLLDTESAEIQINFEAIYENLKNKIPKKLSTRKLNSYLLNELGNKYVVGSADLGESTCTNTSNYLHFGVREHAMVATMGGMSVYGRRTVCATFLTFLDYARPSIRLAALMKIRMIILATHDSIGVGEDGPTHQPVEQLNSYRIMPNVQVWRPCNLEEMIAAWESADSHSGPTIIACTRQDIEIFSSDLNQARKGGYVMRESTKDTSFIGTGSEASLLMQQKDIEVISVPCIEVFEQQDKQYKNNLLSKKNRISVEAGNTMIWGKYATQSIGVNNFGASAKAEILYSNLIQALQGLI